MKQAFRHVRLQFTHPIAVKWQALAAPPLFRTTTEEMNALSEINAAVIKTSAAEKHTPMMRQCFSL